MTSQSPAKSGLPTPEYMNAWMGTRAMLLEGASWSGRERNFCFLNIGDERFVDVSAISAANCVGDGRSMIPIDWDEDGTQDLLLKSRTGPRLQLFHNRTPGQGHFVSVQLEGSAGTNRDAIGARVELEAGGKVYARTLQAGSGFLAQAPKRLHFGIGDAQVVESLRVRWPDGAAEGFTGTSGSPTLAADARYLLRQSTGIAERLESTVRGAGFDELASAEEEPVTGGRRRVPLVDRLPLNPLVVPAYDHPARRVESFVGRPTLLNLWGSDCAACMREFGLFRDRKEDIAAANLNLVALCTDPDRSVAGVEGALERLHRYGLSEGAGYADENFLEAVEIVLAEVIGTSQEIPLPMSLLLDDAGQLSCLYLGPVDVDRLLRDAKRSRRAAAGSDLEALRDRQLLRGIRLYPQERNFPGLARSFRDLDRMDMARFFRSKIPADARPIRAASHEDSQE